jgi:transmembrane sensor
VLSFSGEPLEQVVAEVSRYTSVTIVISDPSIRSVAIGGYFKAGETEAMFEALETSFGVRVTRVNDRLVYLAAK